MLALSSPIRNELFPNISYACRSGTNYKCDLCVPSTMGTISREEPSMQVDYGLSGPHAAGRRIVSVRRPDQPIFNAQLYYPALRSGEGAPV